MIKSKIIFYGMKSQTIGLAGTYLFKPEYPPSEVTRIIGLFNERKIKILLVPITLCAGWRTKLTGKECIVLFTDRFSEAETTQAKARITDGTYIKEENEQQVCVGSSESSKTE